MRRQLQSHSDYISTSYIERQKSRNADGDPPPDALDQCLPEEIGQPEGRVCLALRLLQLLPDTPNAARNPGNGGRINRSRLGIGRTGSNRNLGVTFRVAEDTDCNRHFRHLLRCALLGAL